MSYTPRPTASTPCTSTAHLQRVQPQTPEGALNAIIEAACASVNHFGCAVRYVDAHELRRYTAEPAPSPSFYQQPQQMQQHKRAPVLILRTYRQPQPLLVGIVAAKDRAQPPVVLVSRSVLHGLRYGAPEAVSEAYAIAAGLVATAARCSATARLGQSGHLVCLPSDAGAAVGYTVQYHADATR